MIKKGQLRWLWTTLLVLMVVGYAGWFSFRVYLFVDYDSGDQKQITTLFGLQIREKALPASSFAKLPMKNGRTSLTGTPRWHAAELLLDRATGINEYAGGRVASSMSQLGAVIPLLGLEKASVLKAEYLHALETNDGEAARKIIQKAEENLR